MMAVCGASSVCGRSSFQYECMDPCPGASPGGLQTTSLLCWGITKPESEASSCLSATMGGNSTDPEDSGASQPPPWNNTGDDGRQTKAAPTSLQPKLLEMTVPSSNDQQESAAGVSRGHVGTNNKGNKRVQDADSALQVVSVRKEEGSEYPSEVQEKEEEEDSTVASKEGGISSPARKRLRMGSPSRYTLQERLTSREGEGSPFQHSSPTTSDKGVAQEVSGKRKESGPSASSHSGEQPSKGGRQQQQLWWLTPRSSPVKQFPVQPQSMSKNMEGSRDIMGNYSAFEGGEQRSTLKETDCSLKLRSYNPYMLNMLDTKQGMMMASQTALSSPGGSLTAEANALERPFLSPREFTSSRLGGSNVAPDVEGSSRVADLFPDRRAAAGHGHLPNLSGQEARDATGVNDSGCLERDASLAEAAQHPPRLESTSSDTRYTTGLPLPISNSHGNANTNFYAHIRGAMPLDIIAPQVFPSRKSSQAGVLPTFTQDPLSFGLSTSGLSTSVGHPHAGQAPQQFLERNLQQISKDMIARSLQANAQSSIPVPTFRGSLQTTDASHMNVPPDFSSLEFLQLIQRSTSHGPPQGIGSYVSNFRFSSAPATALYGSVPPELNLSLPASQGSQASALPHSAASSLQEFLTPAAQGSYCPAVNQAQRPEDGFRTKAGDVAGNHALSKSLQLDLSVPTWAVPPSVTAVVEGRSIGQRVCLHDYNSYQGFVQAMRKMFEDCISEEDLVATGQEVHLGNAIPGYVIAYEDEEGDLLLAGDLSWREFVRAAKRIRIVSAVKSSRPNVSTGL